MTQLNPGGARHVIYQGDDMMRLSELRRAVGVAERAVDQGNAMLGDDAAEQVTAARAEFDAFVDEAAERAVTVELRHIGRRRFRDLLAEHKPRMVEVTEGEGDEAKKVEREHEDDTAYGVNAETFPMALLTYIDGDIRTITAPEFSSRADVERFFDNEVSDGDFDEMWVAAYLLNRSPSRDPKALRYSTSPRLGETST